MVNSWARLDAAVKGLIQSVEVVYLVHATEGADKIGNAVARLLGRETDAETEKLEGHYGNEIMRVRIHLTGEDASKAFDSIIGGIPNGSKEEIAKHIDSYLDEHSALFLRFDKQHLVSGAITQGSGDSIRLKVKPRVFLPKQGAPAFYRGLLGSS
jgi:RNA binding exosome subunit